MIGSYLNPDSSLFPLPSIQASSQPDSGLQDQERETQEQQKPAKAPSAGQEGDLQELGASDEPDLSTLSLAEKMALFNRLSHTTAKAGDSPRGDTRQRRANARFQTQPITQGEVAQVKASVQGSSSFECHVSDFKMR